MGKILKPSVGRLILTATFLAHSYFVSYAGINFYIFDMFNTYLKVGLSTIHWNNYFVKSGFLVILWLAIAFIIYFFIWGYEYLRISLHNHKIKNKYINKQKDEYVDLLLKRTTKLKTHIKKYLYYGGGITLFISGLVMVSGVLEKLRIYFLDIITFQLLENGVEFDPTSQVVLIISFIITAGIWYLYSGLISWTFEKGKAAEKVEKISDEHFAVITEEPDETLEENLSEED